MKCDGPVAPMWISGANVASRALPLAVGEPAELAPGLSRRTPLILIEGGGKFTPNLNRDDAHRSRSIGRCWNDHSVRAWAAISRRLPGQDLGLGLAAVRPERVAEQ